MQAGLLTEIISFYKRSETLDSKGGRVSTWVKVSDKRARVQFRSGNRKESNGEMYNTVTNTVTIRICKDINARMRIYHNEQKYNILNINHDRKQQCTVMDIEVINE